MSWIKQMGPVLCTLLFLGLGACLPNLSSQFLNGQLEQEVTVRADLQVSLVVSRDSDLLRTMELFRVQRTLISLTEGERMTAKEAKAAAAEIMRDLTASKAADTPWEVKPMLITSRDTPDLSGVFWYCAWGDASGRQDVLWLDDQSGRMVALEHRWRRPFANRMLMEEGSQTFITVYDDRTRQDAAREMADFCRRYYPVDQVLLSLESEHEDGSDYMLTLSSSGKQEEAYQVLMRLRGEWLYFNL